MSRENRIYRFLTKNPGWQSRDKIMHWTGFYEPRECSVTRYVEFQNSVMRLNVSLARHGGRQVIRWPNFDRDRSEVYQLVAVGTMAA